LLYKENGERIMAATFASFALAADALVAENGGTGTVFELNGQWSYNTSTDRAAAANAYPQFILLKDGVPVGGRDKNSGWSHWHMQSLAKKVETVA
jgi:hypothetical protein